MAFHSSHKNHSQPLAEINTTPLVDVMLVLLVIFIMTAPLLTQSLEIELPQTVQGNPTQQQNAVRVGIAADGSLTLNDTPVTNDLEKRLVSLATPGDTALELQISAHRSTPYEKITEVMSKANAAGIYRIAFVTSPSTAGTTPAPGQPLTR